MFINSFSSLTLEKFTEMYNETFNKHLFDESKLKFLTKHSYSPLFKGEFFNVKIKYNSLNLFFEDLFILDILGKIKKSFLYSKTNIFDCINFILIKDKMITEEDIFNYNLSKDDIGNNFSTVISKRYNVTVLVLNDSLDKNDLIKLIPNIIGINTVNEKSFFKIIEHSNTDASTIYSYNLIISKDFSVESINDEDINKHLSIISKNSSYYSSIFFNKKNFSNFNDFEYEILVYNYLFVICNLINNEGYILFQNFKDLYFPYKKIENNKIFKEDFNIELLYFRLIKFEKYFNNNFLLQKSNTPESVSTRTAFKEYIDIFFS